LRHRCAGEPTKSDFSEALPFGRLWYGEPNSVCNAIGYAKFYNEKTFHALGL
jgi:hypothetical protein